MFVLVAVAAVELAAAGLTSRACAAVTACLAVDPGPGSAVVQMWLCKCLLEVLL